ncbi:hypothetical protein V1525DRAFT_391257 [Lipomyces kononenkoae]|uniref:Uncharacterized protein n=1 Tax=Lipomyces kononenkoae TaxID=34357 RepID=A0ACC3STD8_LIPKO
MLVPTWLQHPTVSGHLEDGELVSGQGPAQIPLSSALFCNIQLAVGRVLRASGAAEVIDKILEDEESLSCGNLEELGGMQGLDELALDPQDCIMDSALNSAISEFAPKVVSKFSMTLALRQRDEARKRSGGQSTRLKCPTRCLAGIVLASKGCDCCAVEWLDGLSNAAKEGIHLRKFMAELGYKQSECTEVFEDDQSHEVLKHLDIAYTF